MAVTKALSHGRDELSLCSEVFGSGVSTITRRKKILLFRQKSPPTRQNDAFLVFDTQVQSIKEISGILECFLCNMERET